MRALGTAILTVTCVSAVAAQDRLPIIDMHLHAPAISDRGVTPPVAICAPFEHFRVRDPAQPYTTFFEELYPKGLPCLDPVWSPDTDEKVMLQTLEVMQRRNIYGVLSGPPDRVAAWRAAAPGRFMAGLHFVLYAESGNLW